MKHVSAVYRTEAVAERVRAEIERLGVPASDVHRISADGGTDGGARLEGLGLPPEDVARYGHAIGGGDHVVVASVVDDEKTATIEGIMRDPEHAKDDDELRADNPEGQLIAPAGEPLAAVGATSTIGAADDGRTTYADPMESGEHRRADGRKPD